jgi:hypothetical protein
MRTPSERDLGRVKLWKEESFKTRRKKAPSVESSISFFISLS